MCRYLYKPSQHKISHAEVNLTRSSVIDVKQKGTLSVGFAWQPSSYMTFCKSIDCTDGSAYASKFYRTVAVAFRWSCLAVSGNSYSLSSGVIGGTRLSSGGP
jgi:hypothetical protein